MKPILVFQTDFTYKEGAVCAMYGVVKSVDREIEIIDGTHEIPKFDIWSASYRLFQSMQFWPQGTIFVSVVDPGVGTARKACAARTVDGYYVVTPDNGSLTHVKHWIGINEVREIDTTINRLHGKNTDGTSVFHGRDLFGYCAARLASGIISFEGVGPAYDVNQVVAFNLQEPVIDNKKVHGIFEISDPNFGNMWTNIPSALFQKAGFNYGDHILATINHDGKKVFSKSLLFQESFGFVQPGEGLIYTNEIMKISMAVNQGNLLEQFSLGWGADWEVEFG